MDALNVELGQLRGVVQKRQLEVDEHTKQIRVAEKRIKRISTRKRPYIFHLLCSEMNREEADRIIGCAIEDIAAATELIDGLRSRIDDQNKRLQHVNQCTHNIDLLGSNNDSGSEESRSEESDGYGTDYGEAGLDEPVSDTRCQQCLNNHVSARDVDMIDEVLADIDASIAAVEDPDTLHTSVTFNYDIPPIVLRVVCNDARRRGWIVQMGHQDSQPRVSCTLVIDRLRSNPSEVNVLP